MPDDYRTMWEELGIDLDAHDGLLEVLPPLFGDVFLSQEGRPARMSYFDYVFSEVHGHRIQELVTHKQKGGIVVGTYCTYAPEELILAAGGGAPLRPASRRAMRDGGKVVWLSLIHI